MPAEEHIQYVPEPSAVHFRGVAGSAIGALLLLGGAIGVLHAIYQSSVPVKAPPSPQQFAQPRVDTNDVNELRGILDAQTKQLETSGWANDRHTLVRIPIERAMQLLAQKGADAYAPLMPPEPALSSPTAGAQRAVTPGEIPAAPTGSKNPPQGPESRP